MKKFVVLLLICVLLLAFSSCVSNDVKDTDKKDSYQIDIEISDDLQVVDINQKMVINNYSKDSWEILKLHLYPNAYRKDSKNTAYFNELAQYGGIEIEKITAEDKQLSYELQDNLTVLVIKLDTPLQAGQEITLGIVARLNIPLTNLRLGLSSEKLNLANFYPILAVYENGAWRDDNYYKVGDPFYSRSADYTVNISCHENLVVASSGVQVSEKIDNNKKQISINGKNIRDFAIVASYKFDVLSATVGKTVVNYYHVDSKDANDMLQVATKALETFNRVIGEYPYDCYNIVETAFYYGGMEYPNLVYINNIAKDKADIIIHETAHQWFACVVGSDSINNSWLDEGLVTFLTYYYHASNGDKDKYQDAIKKEKEVLNSFMRAQKLAYPSGYHARMDKPIYHYATNYEYSIVVYTRGALMFDTLYDFMGEKKLEKALQKYYKDNMYKIAQPEDLFTAFRAVGKDITPIVKAWVGDEVIMSFSPF